MTDQGKPVPTAGGPKVVVLWRYVETGKRIANGDNFISLSDSIAVTRSTLINIFGATWSTLE